MRGAVGVVVLALLVALAGCNGLARDRAATETATVTPVAVPTTDEESGSLAAGTDRAWPPGLANGTLVDPVALVSAHVFELDRRSYTVWHTRQVVTANGTVLVNRSLRGTFSAGERYRVVVDRRGQTTIGDGERTVAYSDGQRASREVSVYRDGERQFLPNRSGTDMPVAPQSILEFRPDFGERLRWAFTSSANLTVDREFSNTLGGGNLNYHVTASLSNTSTGPTVSNGTLRATIDPNGIVRLYSLTYTTTRADRRVRVRERGGYVNLATAE